MVLSHPAARALTLDRRKPYVPAYRGLARQCSPRVPGRAAGSREFQAWALERLSHVHTLSMSPSWMINVSLLDAYMAASDGEVHHKAVAYMKQNLRTSVRTEHEPRPLPALGRMPK